MMENKRELFLLHFEHYLISNKIASILMASMDGCNCENPGQHKSRNIALRILEMEGDVTPSSLSQYLELNKSSVTSLIDSLEKDGFVIRNPDPDDRRKCLISLSPEGRQHLDVLDDFLDWISERIAKHLTGLEYEDFLSSLRKVIEIEKKVEMRLLEEQKKANK